MTSASTSGPGPRLARSTTLLTACDVTQSSAVASLLGWTRLCEHHAAPARALIRPVGVPVSSHLHDEDAHAHSAQHVLVVIEPQLHFLVAALGREPQGKVLTGCCIPMAWPYLHFAPVPVFILNSSPLLPLVPGPP